MSRIDHAAGERELTIHARPETIWPLLVNERDAVRWVGLAAALDPRPGGGYRVEVIPGNVVGGTFLELDPPAGSCSPGAGRRARATRHPRRPAPSRSSSSHTAVTRPAPAPSRSRGRGRGGTPHPRVGPLPAAAGAARGRRRPRTRPLADERPALTGAAVPVRRGQVLSSACAEAAREGGFRRSGPAAPPARRALVVAAVVAAASRTEDAVCRCAFQTLRLTLGHVADRSSLRRRDLTARRSRPARSSTQGSVPR